MLVATADSRTHLFVSFSARERAEQDKGSDCGGRGGRQACRPFAPAEPERVPDERLGERQRRAGEHVAAVESTPIPLAPFTPPSWTGIDLWTLGIELMSKLPLIFHGR